MAESTWRLFLTNKGNISLEPYSTYIKRKKKKKENLFWGVENEGY